MLCVIYYFSIFLVFFHYKILPLQLLSRSCWSIMKLSYPTLNFSDLVPVGGRSWEGVRCISFALCPSHGVKLPSRFVPHVPRQVRRRLLLALGKQYSCHLSTIPGWPSVNTVVVWSFPHLCVSRSVVSPDPFTNSLRNSSFRLNARWSNHKIIKNFKNSFIVPSIKAGNRHGLGRLPGFARVFILHFL
jgi:hypothetical protein